MPVTYAGNPSGAEAPAFAPQGGQAPTLSLPVDADAANAASIYQPFKNLADEIAFMKSGLWQVRYDLHDWQLDNPPPSALTAGEAPIPNYAQGSLYLASPGGGGNTIEVFGPGVGSSVDHYNGRSIEFYVGTNTAPGQLGFYASSSFLAGLSSGLAFCYDTTFGFHSAISAGNNYYVGLAAAPSWTATDGIPAGSILITGAGGQWTAWHQGATVPINVTYNPGNGMQRARVEYFGAATPQGVANGAAFARFSMSPLNSPTLAIVAQINGAMSTQLLLSQGTNWFSASGVPKPVFGPIKSQWAVFT